jgi:hypothetical protein
MKTHPNEALLQGGCAGLRGSQPELASEAAPQLLVDCTPVEAWAEIGLPPVYGVEANCEFPRQRVTVCSAVLSVWDNAEE